MSCEAARTFLTRLFSDEDLRSRILEAGSAEERASIVRSLDCEFTKQELEDAASEIMNATVRELAEGSRPEQVARAAMALLELDRRLTNVLLYGVVDGVALRR